MKNANLPITVTGIPTLKDNYVWAIINEAQKRAIIVDPGEAAPVSAFLQQHQLTLAAIFITHHHWDHTNGTDAVNALDQAPVYGPANEAQAIVTHPLHEEDHITIQGFPPFTVLDIPGHTLGHIAYYTPGYLFCGDTLFAAGCGRLFEGTAAQLYASLQKMAALPPTTAVYCAHEYTVNNLLFAQTIEPQNPHITERLEQVRERRAQAKPSLPSTLQEELATNPFLRCDQSNIKQSMEAQAAQSLNSPLAIFTMLRHCKDHF